MAAELSFVSDPPQDFICQICMKVLREPHVTECCGQHYCKVCLDKWLEKSKEKACPHCRELNFNHILYRPFQRKINELEVYCTHRDEGCGEIMKFAEIRSHLADDCIFVKIDCPNDCGLEIRRKDIDNHVLNDCMKRKELCSYCKYETTYDLMDDHFDVCEKIPVPCPRSCEESLVRGDLQDHEETCPNVMVKCPFYEAGCEKELLRKELDCHVETSSTFHLLKFMASYNALKAAHDALQADYETLKASNEALKADYSTLKAETKQELSDLKYQIAAKSLKTERSPYFTSHATSVPRNPTLPPEFLIPHDELSSTPFAHLPLPSNAPSILSASPPPPPPISAPPFLPAECDFPPLPTDHNLSTILSTHAPELPKFLHDPNRPPNLHTQHLPMDLNHLPRMQKGKSKGRQNKADI